jgi:transposase, IS30 family
LREQGWSIRAAAREAGVSRASGNSWSSGYKTYRHGVVTGLCPRWTRVRCGRSVPAGRLNVPAWMDRAQFLSQEERVEIVDLRQAVLSIRQIAAQLGRAPSTVSRELRRNATQAGGFSCAASDG